MDTADSRTGLSPTDAAMKRAFDILVSVIGLLLTWWIILAAYIIATLDTRQNGFFTQQRIGRNGKVFRIIKLRSMRPVEGIDTTVTTSSDPRVTRVGRFLRDTKIDELPQLINVLIGQMSLVGPRADVAGFADRLVGCDRIVLSVRPGITGPATLKYRNEEGILQRQTDPERYNRDVIYPDKVRINRDYVLNYRFSADLRCLWRTVFG